MWINTLRRTGWVSRTLLSHYRQHPLQALFLLLGLTLGVALWSAVQLINDHARASYEEANQFLGAEARYWIRPEINSAGQGIAQAEYIRLRRLGFTGIYPVIETRLRTSEGDWLTLLATDVMALPLTGSGSPTGGDSATVAGNAIAFMTPDFLTAVPPTVAGRLNVSEGDRITLASGQQLPPTLISSQPQQGERLVVDLAAAFSVLPRTTFDYLGVTRLSAGHEAELRAALPESLRLVTNRQSLDLQELTESLHIQLSAMGWLAFVVGLFIVFNAVRFSLWMRQPTLTTLREMGVGVGELSLAISAEALIWALLGTLFGGSLGFLLGNLLLPSVASSLGSLYGAMVEPAVTLSAGHIAQAGGMTLLGVTLALAGPLWLSAQRSLHAERQSPDDPHQQRYVLRWQALAATVLLVASLLTIRQMTTVNGGFAALALVLLGSALALPPLLYTALKLIIRWLPEHAWLARWALSDAFSQLPHLRVAMMALLLALVANLGVSTLVGSFRTALTDWLSVRLSADLYVQSNTLRIDDLLQQNRVNFTHTHERIGLNIRWQNRTAEIRGVQVNAPDMQVLPLASGPPETLRQWQQGGTGHIPILANEQVQHLAGVQLRDTVTFDTAAGETTFRVVGFFHDYGNPYYAFYLPKSTVAGLWPGAQPLGLALWLDPSAQTPADIERELLAAGAAPGDWINQRDVMNVALQIFDRTFAITGALNTLTLGVAAVALFAALMSVHQQRLTHYAHWRAIGVSASEWLRIVVSPLVLMVALTGLAAIPLGAALSAILIYDLNVVAFGWSMPLTWSWSPVWVLAGMTVITVALTASLALWRVQRQMPSAVMRLGGNG